MGTSVSQGSPDTVNWAAVAAGYRNSAVSVERVVGEIWRAAQSEPTTNWADMLATPVVASCLNVAIQSGEAMAAVSAASRQIATSGQSSLATDIARQAVVQSFGYEDRAQGFVESLFAGTANYLVSRDLHGYVGERWRNQTVRDAVGFKEAIHERVRQVVRDVGHPPEGAGPEAWRQFVVTAVGRLAR